MISHRISRLDSLYVTRIRNEETNDRLNESAYAASLSFPPLCSSFLAVLPRCSPVRLRLRRRFYAILLQLNQTRGLRGVKYDEVVLRLDRNDSTLEYAWSLIKKKEKKKNNCVRMEM